MLERTISRRRLLRDATRAAAGIGAITIVGCGDDETAPAPSPTSGNVTSVPTVTPLPSATPAPQQRSWSRIDAAVAPSLRRDHSLTYNPSDGLLYLFGGRTAGVANNELWTFDPAARVWSQLDAVGPEPRFAHNAVYDPAGQRLIVALGQGNGGFFNDVWAFDGAAWSQLDVASGEQPEIRYGAGGAFDPAANRLLITHGFTDVGRFDDTWAFDLAAGQWSRIATTGAVPIKRCLTRCIWQPSGTLLLFGGQTDDNPFLGDQWSLDAAAGVWTEEKPATVPGPRNLYGASTSPDGAAWYIIGGNTAAGPTAEAWAYAVDAGEWAQLLAEGTSPPARYSTDAAFGGDRLYMFGGHDGTSEIDDLWLLDSQVVVTGST